MRKLLLAGVLVAGVLVYGTTVSQAANSRTSVRVGAVEEFAVLPDGVRFPEGIAANPATGDIYVGTFDSGPNANKLLRFNKSGHLTAQRDFGATPLLGLDFDAAHQKVFILNFGASKVQRIAAAFTSTTPVEDVATIPSIGAPPSRTVPNPDGSADTIVFGSSGFPGPNGMVFDHNGNLYVSDSFQGAIFRIDHATTCTTPCAVTLVSHDTLLGTAGFPPFGANGLALNAAETTLFIANTGDNHVLKMDIPTSAVSVFAESLHGADGLLMDASGRLWVAANQGDEIVALSDKGLPLAHVGEFDGINHDGTPRGLLFPASMVIVGEHMYVTNLALPLTPAVGDEPEEEVTRWNVARFAVRKQ
jgi:DNA-binding beta-propeller fold protein YncE